MRPDAGCCCRVREFESHRCTQDDTKRDGDHGSKVLCKPELAPPAKPHCLDQHSKQDEKQRRRRPKEQARDITSGPDAFQWHALDTEGDSELYMEEELTHGRGEEEIVDDLYSGDDLIEP